VEGLGRPDLLLIDTPGIPPHDRAALRQLLAMLAAVYVDETHLVLSATSSREHLASAAAAFERFGPTRVLLTKLDEALGFGAVLGVFDQLQAPLSYVTNGQLVPDDLHVGQSNEMSRMILGEPICLAAG
jgi:flagellar biosynthesis protein FlhF